jgi:hypothetical protein
MGDEFARATNGESNAAKDARSDQVPRTRRAVMARKSTPFRRGEQFVVDDGAIKLKGSTPKKRQAKRLPRGA